MTPGRKENKMFHSEYHGDEELSASDVFDHLVRGEDDMSDHEAAVGEYATIARKAAADILSGLGDTTVAVNRTWTQMVDKLSVMLLEHWCDESRCRPEVFIDLMRVYSVIVSLCFVQTGSQIRSDEEEG